MQSRFDMQLGRLTSSQGRRSGFLLALSGGVDSMTLAHLFVHSPLVQSCPLAVAHANFSLRGAESDADEALVRDWAAAHGLPFHCRRFDTAAEAARRGVSIEMAARDLRYAWFAELLAELGLGYVAVAHHLNDSAETLLLNLVRGTGLRGLTGIRPVNGAVIRPMLGFTRAEILAFATASGIAFREDATNRDDRYARNRIRNEVLPALAQINPAYLANMARTMAHLEEAQAVLDDFLAGKAATLTRREGGATLIDAQALSAESFRRYLLYRLLNPFGFNEAQLEAVEAVLSAEGSGRRFYSDTHLLLQDRGFLKLYPLLAAGEDDGAVQVSIRITPRPEDFDPRSLPQGTLVADADALALPLRCRRWLPGDRFRPLGMQGFRKLSDFFVDEKLDRAQKARQAVVTTSIGGEERIVCIAGLRLDDRVRVTEATRTLVWIEKI